MSAIMEATKAINQANYGSVSMRVGVFRSRTTLTKDIEMVARAKGSPTMLERLALLRLGAFMLLRGFFKDGE